MTLPQSSNGRVADRPEVALARNTCLWAGIRSYDRTSQSLCGLIDPSLDASMKLVTPVEDRKPCAQYVAITRDLVDRAIGILAAMEQIIS